MTKRFIVRFSICREGQPYSPTLFETNDLNIAVFWSKLDGITVLDRDHNLYPVVTLDGVYYG